MASRIKALLNRKGGAPPSDDPVDAIRPALLRRQKLIARILTFAPLLRNLLIVVGLLYTVALPYKDLGRKHYISENALQPGHVRCSVSSKGSFGLTYLSFFPGQHILELGGRSYRRYVRGQRGQMECRRSDDGAVSAIVIALSTSSF